MTTEETVPVVAFRNNREVARAIISFIKESESNPRSSFTLRPFNRFDPEHTDWWIVPSSEWPAYKFSKFCFHRRPRSPEGLLYVGYYVEKGLGRKLHKWVHPRYIMGNDWFWHRFVSLAKEGSVEETAKEVCKSVGTSVHILIEVYAFNRVPEYDRQPNEPSDQVEFALRFPDFEWDLFRPAQNVLAPTNESDGIRSLVQQIEDLQNDLDFYWLDWIIGVRFRYGQEDSPGWRAPDLWSRVLKFWMPFGFQEAVES